MIENDRATCKSCGMVTCTICESPSHNGDCPKDTALHSLLQTAAKHAWQRCFACRRVVELIQGCYHMSCGAEFCYKCGKKWKSCRCVRWDEHFIIHPVGRANQIADQHNDDDDDDDDDEEEDCIQGAWEPIRGQFECNRRRSEQLVYINQCRQCGIQFCHRGRRS